ncbi:MAG: hypothetical protein AAFY35_16025 [Pseudomonadota bacterium]
MQNMLSGLAALHQLAASRGDGLIPELLELAQRDQRLLQQGAVPLNAPQTSSGPAPQSASLAEADDTVTVLRSPAQDRPSKNTG